MSAAVITPPEPVVALAQAKKHLRVEHDDEDEYITDLVEVATAWIDGPEGWLGRSLGEQTLELQLACFPRPLRLPLPPEIEVVSVKYIDPNGVEQTWPFPTPLMYDNLPAVRGRDGDIRIRWKAGYAEGKVPAPIRHAVLLMVGHLYQSREAVSTAAHKPEQLPMGVDALLAPYRVWRV